MKREILLSPACRAPQLWGYTGEKEHTRITVELPEDIAGCNFYRAEITIKGKMFRTDYLEILDGKVCFELTSAMVEASGVVTAQVIGYIVDDNGDIEEIGKTEIYKGNIKKSLSGKLTPADSDPSLLDRILAKLNELLDKAHTHRNHKTLEGFYCESLETGFSFDVSSNELKWQGKPVMFEGFGATIRKAGPDVNENGDNVYRIWLNWGSMSYEAPAEYIDIPITGVKNSATQNNGGVISNGEELDLGLGAKSGGIKSVSALPETANEGDVVYYCPPANTLTAADAYHKVYIDMNEVKRALEYMNSLDFNYEGWFTIALYLSEIEQNGISISVTAPQMDISFTGVFAEGYKTIGNGWGKAEGEEAVQYKAENSVYSDDEQMYLLPYPILSFNIGAIDEQYMLDNSVVEAVSMPEFKLLYTLPRFYRFTNSKWVELPYTKPELPSEVDCVLDNMNLGYGYGILPNILYNFGEIDQLKVGFIEEEVDKANEYKFSFISGETATVLTLPSSVKWVNELTVEANKRYEISVVDNVALWCAVDYTAEVTE